MTEHTSPNYEYLKANAPEVTVSYLWRKLAFADTCLRAGYGPNLGHEEVIAICTALLERMEENVND